MQSLERILNQVAEDGFAILDGVFAPEHVGKMLGELSQALHSPADAASIRSSGGSVYAARNVLTLWPAAARVCDQTPLPEVLSAVLGPGYGLVRVLFFDKPPDRTWALPWHKDLTIAVRDNSLPSRVFSKPTRKEGVPHVEAPVQLLEQMATLRIHLDDVTDENGPLRVAVGSHRTGKELAPSELPARDILVQAGDVLLMRPLLSHCSGASHQGTHRHRRILHLEFAASAELPDGFAWHEFRRARPSKPA